MLVSDSQRVAPGMELNHAGHRHWSAVDGARRPVESTSCLRGRRTTRTVLWLTVAYGNPTWTALEEVIGVLEGGEAVCFASGMAAVAAVFDHVPLGGVIVLPHDGYYGTRAFADSTVAGRWEIRRVEISDTDSVAAACRGAALLWVESPTNPKMDIADIPALCRAAHTEGLLVAVDNTFMTPLGQLPLELGADIVVHSVTKLLAGHSDAVIGAAVAAPGSALGASLRRRRSAAGAIPGPMEAYLALRGVRTLPLRFYQAQSNAGELALRLARHPEVECVRYPGLPDNRWHERARAQMRGYGNMIAFEVLGGASRARGRGELHSADRARHQSRGHRELDGASCQVVG